jgi:anaerobic ribonucleoside-triphosphate reductase
MSETKKRVIRCLVMSRVCGYFADVTSFNRGKRQEFADRKVFDVAEARKAAQHD